MANPTVYSRADFYLDIARYSLEQLGRLHKRGSRRWIGNGYSSHFRHAVVCIVFSAFAVEHALTELIWISCYLSTPEPHRVLTRLLAS